MITKTLCYIALPLIISLSACSSLPESNGVTKENDRMFSNEVNYPDWYVEGGGKDKSGIYAVGSEYSKNFQFSVDKSMLSAKRELAANFSSYVSAMMKDFTFESGATEDIASTDIDRTTKMVVARINLVGVQRTHFKVVHEGKGYRTFVKLRYSTDESNKLLMAEIRKNQMIYARLKSSKSFQELEAEVEKIEKQKVDEIKAMNGE
jgi:ribosomal protein S13